MSSDPLGDLDGFITEAEIAMPGFREAREDLINAQTVVMAMIAVRQIRKLSQSDVAERMGITQPTVSEFETWQSDPRLSTLQRYARAIGGRIEIRYAAVSE